MLISILIFFFFFKKRSFSFICFGQILVPKSEVLQVNWNLVQRYIAICLLHFNVYFFQNSFHLYFLGNFGPEIWSSPSQLKFSTGIHCYMLITIVMFVFFSKLLLFIFLGANLVLKTEVLQINWNVVQDYIAICFLQF